MSEKMLQTVVQMNAEKQALQTEVHGEISY